MTIRIFITGLIRPHASNVIEVIQTIRSQMPDAITYMCTWTNQDVSLINEHVDHCIQIEEPDIEKVRSQITATTLTDNKPDCATLGWPYLTYRMFTPVNALIDYVQPWDHDIIVRIRSDTIFQFDSNHLANLLEEAKTSYVYRNSPSSGVSFSDWFAIANARDFKKGWYFQTMNEYNAMLQDTWNTEDVIRRRLLKEGVRLVQIDETKLHCYIIRPGPKKEYHGTAQTMVVESRVIPIQVFPINMKITNEQVQNISRSNGNAYWWNNNVR